MAACRKFPAKTANFVIYAYRYTLSPLLGPCCRFEPSCAVYAIGAIQNLGLLKGCWLTLKRLSYCHPWGRHGYDPVPKKEEIKA